MAHCIESTRLDFQWYPRQDSDRSAMTSNLFYNILSRQGGTINGRVTKARPVGHWIWKGRVKTIRPREEEHGNLPVFVLYSIMVDAGRFRTLLSVSLMQTHVYNSRLITEHRLNSPNLLPALFIPSHPIPHTDDIFTLPHADRAPTDLRQLPLRPILHPIPLLPSVINGVRVHSPTIIKEVAHYGQNEVFPEAIGDAFSETDDPFSSREVEGVFPYRSTDRRMEEEVVGSRLERGWWS